MKKHNPQMKGVIDQAYDLVQKILKWRSMRLEKSLHIKYEPNKANSKSHFEAIMADVNEDVKQVEQAIKLHELSEAIVAEMPLDIMDSIDFSFDDKDNRKIKADIEHKKRLKEQKETQMHIDSKTKR